MKGFLFFFLLVIGASAPGEFRTIDIFVDSGAESLAAYQLEFSADKKRIRIVGVEGGDHAAFKNPPFYDPKAMQRERVILAAFSTGKELSTGKVRVATIHVQVIGGDPISYQLKAQTAANADGARISVHPSLYERRSE